ncbi:hypothetical protein GWI34_29425 [Actinomadura sp. DSM 109109]|nr:hypothetical protein [Actinomadura lepetitiana]
MSVLIIVIATALSSFIFGWWLHNSYAVARDSFLLSRQQKAIRKLEKENARLCAILTPESDSA